MQRAVAHVLSSNMSPVVLPTKILLSIVPYLQNEDLKSFRLCSPLLTEEAERYLFETISILYLRKDFERVKALTHHDRLRLRVRKILYVGDRFPSNLTMEQWRHHYSRDRHAQMNSMVWLRHPYEQYRRMSDEQQVGTAEFLFFIC